MKKLAKCVLTYHACAKIDPPLIKYVVMLAAAFPQAPVVRGCYWANFNESTIGEYGFKPICQDKESQRRKWMEHKLYSDNMSIPEEKKQSILDTCCPYKLCPTSVSFWNLYDSLYWQCRINPSLPIVLYFHYSLLVTRCYTAQFKLIYLL